IPNHRIEGNYRRPLPGRHYLVDVRLLDRPSNSHRRSNEKEKDNSKPERACKSNPDCSNGLHAGGPQQS
ncbi:MAG TPA: hypothetical protein VLJ79_18955, partial [Candidatus Binatia bacterium]|nr:hypothetical protein [Candidatus Binatia bacterium]